MSSNNDFKPGLEGVVAVETEIREPDRDGGMLRYRGVDVEPLIGKVPYENVWGLLVDDDLHSTMPDPEPYEPVGLTGNAPADLQAETARLGGEWKLGKLNEISVEQAREDLGRLSAQMMSIVARSARVREADAGRSDADGRPGEVGARRAREPQANHGLRAPRVPRRGPAVADPEAHREGARVAAVRGGSATRACGVEGAAGEVAGPCSCDQRRVLLGDRSRRRRDSTAAGARDVRVLPRGRLVGAHPRAEANRPAVPPVG